MKQPLLLATLLWILVTGCRSQPRYATSPPSVPQAFHAASRSQQNAPEPHSPLATWWESFHDPGLNALILEAIAANLDIRLARARLREARAQAGIAHAALFPEISLLANASRSRLSENSIEGRSARAAGAGSHINAFSSSFDMTWELDVFGALTHERNAAQAQLGAAAEASRDTLISILAEVGLNYLQLRGVQNQLLFARENLRVQEETLALSRDRLRAGLANELDVVRAEAQTQSTRAVLSPLEAEELRAAHRISLLLGRSPEQLLPLLAEPIPLAQTPAALPVGLPSDLLQRRPDIRKAERSLAAAMANTSSAKADLFPRFFLTGAAGFQSLEASDVATAGSRLWSLGPGLRWPIFSSGRIRHNIRVQSARQEQALLQYEQAILTALEEVENALVGFGKEQDRHQALRASEAASLRAVALAQDRYRSGLVDFLDVLQAQQSSLQVQDSVAQSHRAVSQHLVRLYKALGGGWDLDALAAAHAEAAPESTQTTATAYPR